MSMVRMDLTLEEKNRDAKFYNEQGNEFFLKDDLDQAYICFNRAIELDPNLAEAYYNLGLLYHAQHNYNRAFSNYHQAIFHDSTLIEARLGLALVYKDQNNDHFAFDEFKKILEQDPNFIQAYMARGGIYQARKEYDRAIADYDKAIELDPNLANAYYERGSIYQAKGEYDRAIADYDKVIELDSSLANAYYKRGNIYQARKKYAHAVADYDVAIKLEPKLAITYYKNPSSYISKNYPEWTETVDNIVFKLDPSLAVDRDYNSANMWLKLGYYTMAISDYDKVIQYASQISSTEFATKLSSTYSKRELAYCQPDTAQLDILIRLLLPDLDNGERLVTENDWLDSLKIVTEQSFDIRAANLERYSRECWNEILEERKYQVSPEGRVEVMASDELKHFINLVSIKFVQEGVKPPGVFMRFQFEDGGAVGIVKINQDGSTQGFHQRSGNRLFQAIIDSIALSYFRDLVTPGKPSYYKPNTGKSCRPLTNPNPRKIPRPQNKPTSPPKPKPISISTWQKHYVFGHRRRLPKGQRASLEKYQESLDFLGVPLEEGYTYVNAYERGTVGDLSEKFLCLPPDRALSELRELIWSDQKRV